MSSWLQADVRVPAWSCTPADLRALGYDRDPHHLFGRLQRISTWDEGGPSLARPGRALAERALDLRLPTIVEERRSVDGATRIVLELADGERIEAVHMPRELARPRVTVCLSSQVGCAMGCTFCATATMGLRRHLAAHEIVGQLLAVMRRHGPDSAETLNVVFMGMGEPLHNVSELLRALEVLCDPAGLGLAPRRITVSTAGHVSGLARLAASRYLPELAVSVNGVTGDVRRRLMPIDRRWSLAELRAALDLWPRHRKITFEYVLLAGVNDDDESAARLAAWVGDLRHVVNVIPFNAWAERSPYREPSPDRVASFVWTLREHGCVVKVRCSRGRDARAACGTLVATLKRASVSGSTRAS
jgi:23S rRNA (adenine2503-C2)-methyltransferase